MLPGILSDIADITELKVAEVMAVALSIEHVMRSACGRSESLRLRPPKSFIY